MNSRICAALTLLGLLFIGARVGAAEQPKYIECAPPATDSQEKPTGSVWTFALITQPQPKLLERIEIGIGDVQLFGRLTSMSDAETSFVNERGARKVVVWEAQTAASIKGKVDSKFYTFDTCTTLWACRNSFRFSREDLSLWVAHGASLGSPANWHKTTFECRFIEREQFAAALDQARAQVELNAQIEREVLQMREPERLF